MATIDTIEDFIRVMDENPKWLEAVRARLLTSELLALPQRFDTLETVQAQILETQARQETTIAQILETQARQETAIAQILETQARQETAIRELRESQLRTENTLQRFMESTNARFEALESDVKGLRDDVADIKGFHAREIALRHIPFIPMRMGFRIKSVLSIADLANILQDADTSDISESDLISFQGADIIILATDPEGADCYVSVEVSHTIYPKDIERAVRNAGLLTRFTGLPAYPAVSGMNVNWRAQDAVDSKEAHFYRLRAQMFKAD